MFENCQLLTVNMKHAHTESIVSNSMNYINTNLQPESDIKYSSPQEIKYFIHSLKNRKSPGNDNVPNLLLKKLPKKGLIYLLLIFNACIKFKYFPEIWKHTKICAIPKPNKAHTNP